MTADGSGGLSSRRTAVIIAVTLVATRLLAQRRTDRSSRT